MQVSLTLTGLSASVIGLVNRVEDSKWPPSGAAFQFAPAARNLLTITFGITLDPAGYLGQPGFFLIAAFCVTAMPLMVGQILPVWIPFRDTEFAVSRFHIPADEIHRIIVIIPVRPAVTRLFPVPVPGGVFDLGITIGGGFTKPGDKPEQLLSGWFGIMSEPGFLMDECQL
ncbi:hypothetical protein A3195_18935 [Candidatus Thiodiazotropha endoloripes]|uniref:Uncharacterized protein n=1 Tax=Candidatus Thiodiazotropha endoloripes TaxID=1818881 RepID=A0A1E2UHT4_9GAMM|nr:hypothetical protein A3195_18935 [Candidatus Thiodiazotropha endoloripes]ODB92898.1 hypothetical protein A3196_19190 [Candidatus Thiodiazotropha endoloripes]